MICNDIYYKVWGVIAYSFPNSNSVVVGNKEWMTNLIPHLTTVSNCTLLNAEVNLKVRCPNSLYGAATSFAVKLLTCECRRTSLMINVNSLSNGLVISDLSHHVVPLTGDPCVRRKTMAYGQCHWAPCYYLTIWRIVTWTFTNTIYWTNSLITQSDWRRRLAYCFIWKPSLGTLTVSGAFTTHSPSKVLRKVVT